MLLGAAAIVVLGAAVLCWLYLRDFNDLRTTQGQAQGFNNRQQLVNSLVADVMEYSKTHKDVEPILESAGITNRANRTETKTPAK